MVLYTHSNPNAPTGLPLQFLAAVRVKLEGPSKDFEVCQKFPSLARQAVEREEALYG